MSEEIKETSGNELQFVFDGTDSDADTDDKCSAECVGGTANTKAMHETNPSAD